jgi:hypothetical protein
MSGKLEGLSAINTNPLTNPFCQNRGGICAECYAKVALMSYRQSCVPLFQRNSELISSGELEDIPIIFSALVRFNAYGELINSTHYENLTRIARRNPHCHFALWTKREDLVDPKLAPKNMNLIYSVAEIDGEPRIPKGFDNCYIVTSSGKTCGERCIVCRRCYLLTGKIIKTVITHQKKIYHNPI